MRGGRTTSAAPRRRCSSATTRWSRGASAGTFGFSGRSQEQRGGAWYRGSSEFGGQRANDWWSLRGPHLYRYHSPPFRDLLPYHKEIPSISTTIGTSTTDVFLLHVVAAAQHVLYTLSLITSLELVSTQNDDITRKAAKAKPPGSPTKNCFRGQRRLLAYIDS